VIPPIAGESREGDCGAAASLASAFSNPGLGLRFGLRFGLGLGLGLEKGEME
jgi:hypothetical protein